MTVDPPPPVPPCAPAWSWRRALAHALVALGVVVAAGALLVAVGAVPEPQRFGEGLGRFGLLAMAVTAGVSYLAQTGRRRAAWGLALGTAGLLGLVTALLLGALRADRSAALTATERADLQLEVRDGERWLTHPTLGFALRHPGPSFEPAQEVATAMASADADDGMATWGFVDRHTGEALAVMAVKGIESRRDLDGFLKGFRDSLEGAGGRIEREDVAWDDARREVRLEMSIEGEARVSIRALGATRGPDRTAFLIATLATTDDPARAAVLVESLSLR
jgi:hypothetical protein